MAALDDIVTPVTSGGNSSSPTVTFASAPAQGDLILLHYTVTNQNFTASPSGFTQLDDRALSPVRSRVLAKIAGASEGTTYSATIAAAGNWSSIGRRIEGPFTNLSTITTNAEDSAYSTSIRILNANVTVGTGNTKVIAIYSTSEASDYFSSATNSFGNLAQAVSSSGGTRSIQVHRLYTTSASDVHTTVTLANPGYGRKVLLRITAPATTSAIAAISSGYHLHGTNR